MPGACGYRYTSPTPRAVRIFHIAPFDMSGPLRYLPAPLIISSLFVSRACLMASLMTCVKGQNVSTEVWMIPAPAAF